MILNQAKIKQFSIVIEGASTLGVLGAEGTSVGRPDSSRLRCKRGAPLAQRHLVLDTPAVCQHPSGITSKKQSRYPCTWWALGIVIENFWTGKWCDGHFTLINGTRNTWGKTQRATCLFFPVSCCEFKQKEVGITAHGLKHNDWNFIDSKKQRSISNLGWWLWIKSCCCLSLAS